MNLYQRLLQHLLSQLTANKYKTHLLNEGGRYPGPFALVVLCLVIPHTLLRAGKTREQRCKLTCVAQVCKCGHLSARTCSKWDSPPSMAQLPTSTISSTTYLSSQTVNSSVQLQTWLRPLCRVGLCRLLLEKHTLQHKIERHTAHCNMEHKIEGHTLHTAHCDMEHKRGRRCVASDGQQRSLHSWV